MLITTQNEIISLMPTARWDRPSQLFGYLEEEESVALEPLLGNRLYQYLIAEYDRLRKKYVDITPTTVRPTGQARQDARLAHADVTERIEQIQNGNYREPYYAPRDGVTEVPAEELATIRLIRICQQIEWYKMLAHKAGLLTVSFNEGGGMNMVSADGYEPADEKRMERVVKDAWMSAGRAVDSLLLFLESDAKGDRLFTDKWQEADAFYLRKDLLFQTARVLNEYLDIKSDRMAYVSLVRDIRFCQNTYLKPRVGAKLLKAAIEFANEGTADNSDYSDSSDSSDYSDSSESSDYYDDKAMALPDGEVMDELVSLLRTALAFYVEGRRVAVEPVKDKLARRDSMTDAQQAMAMACEYIEEHLDALGDAVVGTPIYNNAQAKKRQEIMKKECACREAARQQQLACERNSRRMFTGFPATHITPERK